MINQLHRNILQKKNILHETFSDYNDLLTNVKHLRGDIYFLNISELNQKLARQILPTNRRGTFNKLNDEHDILPCPIDTTNEKLSFICQRSEGAVVLFEKSQLICLYEIVNKVCHDFTSQLSQPHNIIESLAQPDFFHKKYAKGTHCYDVASDCHNFREDYKSDGCSITNLNLENSAVAVDELKNPEILSIVKSIEIKYSTETQSGSREVVENIMTNDNYVDINKNKKISENMIIFLRKFKRDFQNLYEKYMKFNETEILKSDSPYVSVSYSQNNSTNESISNSVAEPDIAVHLTRTEESEPNSYKTKSVSGKWYFSWTKSRAKLRKFNEKTMDINWFLKLEETREDIRNLFSS